VLVSVLSDDFEIELGVLMLVAELDVMELPKVSTELLAVVLLAVVLLAVVLLAVVLLISESNIDVEWTELLVMFVTTAEYVVKLLVVLETVVISVVG
jgi:hypothetical protein